LVDDGTLIISYLKTIDAYLYFHVREESIQKVSDVFKTSVKRFIDTKTSKRCLFNI